MPEVDRRKLQAQDNTCKRRALVLPILQRFADIFLYDIVAFFSSFLAYKKSLYSKQRRPPNKQNFYTKCRDPQTCHSL